MASDSFLSERHVYGHEALVAVDSACAPRVLHAGGPETPARVSPINTRIYGGERTFANYPKHTETDSRPHLIASRTASPSSFLLTIRSSSSIAWRHEQLHAQLRTSQKQKFKKSHQLHAQLHSFTAITASRHLTIRTSFFLRQQQPSGEKHLTERERSA
nr:hypothetical protein Iba_chr05cCG12080 [Ipomoea batatas]